MRISAATLLVLLLAAVPSHAAFDPAVEASNYSKVNERQALYQSPGAQLLLREVSQSNGRAATQAQASAPERNFADALCWSGNDGCAGDARLYNWEAKGYGIV